jgi:hypothetical protein
VPFQMPAAERTIPARKIDLPDDTTTHKILRIRFEDFTYELVPWCA